MKQNILQWLASTTLAFIIRQIEQFKADTDWALVKDELATRVAELVPGTWLDNEAVSVSNSIIDACQRAFDNDKTAGIIQQLVDDGKYNEALSRLRDYLLKAWKPETAADTKAMSLVEATKVKP